MIRHLLQAVSPGGEKARLSILIFHRVIAQPDPLFPEGLHAARFDAICRWLRAWCNVLPLEHGLTLLRDGTLPPRAAAITFDDGYADNHDVAWPILQRHGLTATIFVATGYVGFGRMWNDIVIDAVRYAAPGRLQVPVLETLGMAMPYLGDAQSRRATIDRLLEAIKYFPPDERDRIARRLATGTGAELNASPMMSRQQILALRKGGMGIGAHTVTHPILAGISDDQARAEMRNSKYWLEDLLDEPVALFAYPNGKRDKDYGPQHAAMACELGFHAALSTDWGVARRGTDCFQLPRFSPWGTSRLRYGLGLWQNLRSVGAKT